VVGPNGSGKSSLLGLLAGRRPCSAGRVRWHPPLDGSARRAALGHAAQSLELDPELTVREHLTLFRALERLPGACVSRVIADFGLGAFLEQRVQRCSLGMRQRLHLALAFLKQPALLLLDEPANALDVEARAALTQALQARRAHRLTSVLVTHDLGEVARVADHVFFLARGSLLAQGTPDALARVHGDLGAAYLALVGEPGPPPAGRSGRRRAG
jgi:ABC-type multidrug transport system ATPase subunit